MRKDEIMALYPNTYKAQKILNWRPKISLNIGLKKTINFYKNEVFTKIRSRRIYNPERIS